jgi:hypothetical protein
MQAMEAKIQNEKLFNVAVRCLDQFISAESKLNALRIISEIISREFGFYLNPFILEEPDDVSVGFVELLDQVIFEIEDVQNSNDNKIEGYIIEDLHQRVESYLDVLYDADLYKRNLGKRIINIEDTKIIKRYSFSEYVPLLISEFGEQVNLRQPVLKALLSFYSEDLLRFYYDILKKEYDPDIKVLALIGLKNPRYMFDNWHMLDAGNGDYGNLVDYLKTCSYDGHDGTGMHDNNLFISLFKIMKIELMIPVKSTSDYYQWVIDTLSALPIKNIENTPFQAPIYESISNILNRMRVGILRSVLMMDEGDNIPKFVSFVDGLPIEIYDRIINMLDYLGEEFIVRVERLISLGKINLSERNSNMLGYLFSNGFNSALL